MSDFEKLLGELNAAGEETEEMRKAMDADEGADEGDDRIQTAAEDGDEGAGGDDSAEGSDDGADGGEGGDDDDDDGEEEMGKSFMLQLENGEEVEAFDGTEMLKSLQADLNATKKRLEASENKSTEALGKALEVVNTQKDMIKSLQDQVTALRSAGRGRKAVVSVSDAGNGQQLQKSEDLTGPQFMAKAMTAMESGRVTGSEVARMESYLNKGLQIPQELADKVFQQ